MTLRKQLKLQEEDFSNNNRTLVEQHEAAMQSLGRAESNQRSKLELKIECLELKLKDEATAFSRKLNETSRQTCLTVEKELLLSSQREYALQLKLNSLQESYAHVQKAQTETKEMTKRRDSLLLELHDELFLSEQEIDKLTKCLDEANGQAKVEEHRRMTLNNAHLRMLHEWEQDRAKWADQIKSYK